MKIVIISILILVSTIVYSQNKSEIVNIVKNPASAVFYVISNCNEKFYVVLDSVRQSDSALFSQEIKVSEGTKHVLIFMEKSNVPINKSITFTGGKRHEFRINKIKENKLDRDFKNIDYSITKDLHKLMPNSVDSPVPPAHEEMYDLEVISVTQMEVTNTDNPALNFPVK